MPHQVECSRWFADHINPVRVTDLFATMDKALGVGPETEVVDQTGRPLFPVKGNPVSAAF